MSCSFGHKNSTLKFFDGVLFKRAVSGLTQGEAETHARKARWHPSQLTKVEKDQDGYAVYVSVQI